MNAKHRMLFITVIWIVLLVLAIFIPDAFRLIWVVGVSVACLLFLVLNLLEFKGVRFDPYTGIAKKQGEQVKPCDPDLQNKFNYQLLIDLAALISGGDTNVIKEVTSAAFDYENYKTEFLSHSLPGESCIPEERFRERWYPNTQADVSLMFDYIDKRPAFCCMNMLNWLIDKGYVVLMHKETDCEEFINLFDGALKRQGLSVCIKEMPLKKDDEVTGRFYPLDNLEILANELCAMDYYLLHLDIDGDFHLAIVNQSVCHQILALDWESVKSELAIEVFGVDQGASRMN